MDGDKFEFPRFVRIFGFSCRGDSLGIEGDDEVTAGGSV